MRSRPLCGGSDEMKLFQPEATDRLYDNRSPRAQLQSGAEFQRTGLLLGIFDFKRPGMPCPTALLKPFSSFCRATPKHSFARFQQ